VDKEKLFGEFKHMPRVSCAVMTCIQRLQQNRRIAQLVYKLNL